MIDQFLQLQLLTIVEWALGKCTHVWKESLDPWSSNSQSSLSHIYFEYVSRWEMLKIPFIFSLPNVTIFVAWNLCVNPHIIAM